jgi:protein required for attachment to host cells
MTKSVMKPRRKARLPAAPPMAPRHTHTLVVVADGTRARFFELSPDLRSLVPARSADMISPMSRRPARDIVSDRPGRGFSSADSTARHAFEAPHDHRKLEKHNFTVELAQALEASHTRHEFDRLVLVAPSRSLGELRALLSPQVRQLVAHEVGKDLTERTPDAIRQALDDVLPMPAAAAR